MLGDIAILIVLILLNGIFSATEIALLSVSPSKVRLQAEAGNKKAQLLKKTIDNPNNFLSTIQLGISLLSLFSGAFAATSMGDEVINLLTASGLISGENPALRIMVTLLITIVLSYFTLVFGELVPKRLGMNKSEKLARAMVEPVYIMSVVATPFVKILSGSTNFVLRLIRINPEDSVNDVTEEAIRVLVDDAGDSGGIDLSEREMINNIFEFDNKAVGDIAVHRKDIAALEVDSGREEIINTVTNENYSRIPVYEDSIDNIIGILHVKDFMSHILSTKDVDKDIDLRTLMRDPYFVPLSKKTDKLFDEMKKSKVHMAIVVDEYGGTEGLVTMEDLIEEIMGNIYDEYDEVETPLINQLDDNTYLVNGTTNLEIIADFFGKNLPVDEFDTVSGFVIGQLGRIPGESERTEITYNGLVFKIYKVEDKRITDVVIETLQV